MADFIITIEDSEFEMDRQDIASLNAYTRNDKNLHVLHDQKSYQVALLEEDFQNKKVTLLVNGNPYKVSIADEYDQLIKQMGLLEKSNQKQKDIKAPMPGLIVDILVQEGQAFAKGDSLIILSAMKMENVIAAEGDGVVKRIAVEKNDAVDKGQLLIEIA